LPIHSLVIHFDGGAFIESWRYRGTRLVLLRYIADM
jgi:hypothetical protein